MRNVMTTLGAIVLTGVWALAQPPQPSDASANQPTTAPVPCTQPAANLAISAAAPAAAVPVLTATDPPENGGSYAYIVPSKPGGPRGGLTVVESILGRPTAQPSEPPPSGPTLIEPAPPPRPPLNYGPDGDSYPDPDFRDFMISHGFFPDINGYLPLTGDAVQILCDHGMGHPFFCPSEYIVKHLEAAIRGQ